MLSGSLPALATPAESLYESIAMAPEHRLWLEFNSGLEDSKSYRADLDLVLAKENHLLLGAGKSDVQGSDRRVDLYSYTAGLHAPYDDPFTFGMEYEFWGNTDELWTRTLSLPVAWNTAEWRLGLRPGYTAISLYVQPPNRPRRQVDSSSTFLEGELDHYGPGGLTLSVHGGIYAYEHDLSGLARPLAAYLFSDVTLILGYGFPHSRLGADITYDFARWRLGAGYERTRSEVDDSALDVLSAKVAFFPGSSLGLHAEGGRVETEQTPSYNYLRLATEVFF